jgi:glycine cleavage system aminomethyltransferase T
MAYIETPFARVGTKVTVNIRNRTIDAEVMKKPFVSTNYYKASTSKKKN